jgi:hypothetical protein
MRCLREGIYDFGGAVIFNSADQTGDRAVSINQVSGPYTWGFVQSMPMPKVTGGGIIVSGETYQYVNNTVELRAYSTVSTSTTPNPQSEWLSATLISNSPKKGDEALVAFDNRREVWVVVWWPS